MSSNTNVKNKRNKKFTKKGKKKTQQWKEKQPTLETHGRVKKLPGGGTLTVGPLYYPPKSDKGTPEFVNEKSPDTVSISTIRAQTTINTQAIHIAMATAMSYYARGRYSEVSFSLTDQDAMLTYFCATVGQYIQDTITMQIPIIKDVPYWAWSIAMALSPRSIKTAKSVIDYAGEITTNASYTFPAKIILVTGTEYWTQDVVNSSLVIAHVPTAYTSDVSQYIRVTQASAGDTCRFMQLVKSDQPIPNKWKYDASGFARSYSYFGDSGTHQGLYNNLELEVPIHYPMLSRFVEYKSYDPEISRHFMPSTGGPSSLVGTMLLHPSFSMKHLQNRFPTIYKFIDFWEVFAAVVSPLVMAFSNIAVESGNIHRETLPFGLMDFAIVVRQALLYIFKEQIESQFIAPYKFSGSNTEATFQPFIVDQISTPSATYSNFILPTFLKSNLTFLREYIHHFKSVKFNTEKQTQYVRYVPVLGWFKGDTPPAFNFKDYEGNLQPFFNPSNQLATENFNIADLKITSGDNKYNPNFQGFLNIQSSWNAYMTAYQGYFATGLGGIGSDISPKINLLPFTRHQGPYQELGTENAFLPKIKNPFDGMITGYVPKRFDKEKEKKIKPTAPPPSSLEELTQRGIYSVESINPEMKSVLDFMLLPTVRIPDDSNTEPDPKMSLRQYRTYCGEFTTLTSSVGWANPGQIEYQRIMKVAEALIVPVGASGTGNDIVEVTKELETQGEGGNLFGTLLDSFLNAIPVVGPILAQI